LLGHTGRFFSFQSGVFHTKRVTLPLTNGACISAYGSNQRINSLYSQYG